MNYCQLTILFYFPSYRLTVVGKAFEGNTDLVEEWYGTEYSIHKIPSENIEVREYHQFKLSFCTLRVRSRSTNCHVLCILLVKIPFYWCVRRIKSLQWNLDLTKCEGTGEIGSLYRGFVISRFFSIHYTWRHAQASQDGRQRLFRVGCLNSPLSN